MRFVTQSMQLGVPGDPEDSSCMNIIDEKRIGHVQVLPKTSGGLMKQDELETAFLSFDAL